MFDTYKVPEQNVEQLLARIAKLAKRCVRIGVAAPVLVIGDFVERTYTTDRQGHEMTIPVVRRIFTVTLDAPERPKIEGYEFIGTVSPVMDDAGNVLGNILRMVPGNDAPAEYRNATNYCDHCKTDRRRSETFLVKSDAGVRQIGRNCLAGYLGFANPHNMAALAELLIHASELCGLSEDEDGFGFGNRTHERYPLEDVLIVAASAIRLYGWLSNKSAKEFMKQSTSGKVNDWLFGSAKDRERFEFPLIATEADRVLAADTIAWLETLGEPTDDYMYNLSLLGRAATISPKIFGIAVSAINAFSRENEREIRRNARFADDKASEYIGHLGDRLDFDATVVYANIWENDFGVTHFYKMKQGDNVVVYFASKDMGWEMGQTVKFKATVKKHDLRDGINQTIVTRAKLPAYIPTKEEKKAVAKLRRVLKTVEYNGENYPVHVALDAIIRDFKDGKFATPAQEVV